MTSRLYNDRKAHYVEYLCQTCGVTEPAEMKQIGRLSLPVLERVTDIIRKSKSW